MLGNVAWWATYKQLLTYHVFFTSKGLFWFLDVTNFIDVVISDIDKQLLATDKNTVPINIANQ